MELTPQLLTDEIDFRIAVRGYDRHEVDDFLERVAVAVGQLQSQLTKAVARAKAAEARVAELEGAPGTPAAAQPEVTPERESAEAVGKTPTLHEPVETPEVTAPKAPPSAPVPVVGDDEDLNDELRRTLVLAQRTADTAIREAHDEARQIVDQANDEARRNREAAEAAHAKARDEAHSRLVAEIRELESTREAMRDDTVVLERYLGTERARVRETIQVLRRLVDEPQSFRTGTVPELSGATTPAELGPAPDETTATSGDDGSNGSSPSSDEATPQVDDPPAIASGGGADVTKPEADAPPLTPRVPDSASGGATPHPVGSTDATISGPTGGDASGAATRTDEVAGSGTADGDPSELAPEPAGEGAASVPTTSDAEDLGQLFASSDSTKDWRSAGADRGDQGPHTQPVAAARFEEESDEAFLAELRRAMNDDEPLGPDDKG